MLSYKAYIRFTSQSNNFKIAGNMKRLLNFINDLDMDERTEHIIDGVLDNNALPIKVRECGEMRGNDQTVYLFKLAERMKQITKPYKLLTVMTLIEQITKANPQLQLPKLQSPSLRLNKTKQHLILSNLARYYDYFLILNNCSKYNIQTINVEEQLQQAEHYCQLAVLKMLEFIRIDFIFVYGWTKLEKYRYLLREIVGSMLERFKEDLKIVNTFVNNNLGLVLQKTVKHPLAFNINHIYQKLIAINKEMKKIEKIAKLYQLNSELPRYEIDLQLNRAVEMEMLDRKEQKRDFYKRLSEQPKQHSQMQQVDIMSTESFILLNDEEDQ